jgi:hypothetical protein
MVTFPGVKLPAAFTQARAPADKWSDERMPLGRPQWISCFDFLPAEGFGSAEIGRTIEIGFHIDCERRSC